MNFGFIINIRLFIFLILWNVIACGSSKKVHPDNPILMENKTNNSDAIDTFGKVAKIVFDSSKYQFGFIKQSEILSREIYFTNQGPGDLLIQLMSTCECTSLDWSRLPIKSGYKGMIKIIYNSKDKMGPQIVDIDIIANTNPSITSMKFYLTVE